MVQQISPVLSILNDESDRALAGQLATILGHPFSHIVIGTGTDAGRYIQEQQITPKYILFMIADRDQQEVISELQELANHCVSGTEVIVVGRINDINFYRTLMDCGVLEYFAEPVEVSDIARGFSRSNQTHAKGKSNVVSFIGAASGDGSSTIALNVAYSLANDRKEKTVIVDMDYQFGMLAKNLDLSSPYGIKELFDHPDRGIDTTLVERMAIEYDEYLDVIAAPNVLKFYPEIKPEIIRDLLAALNQRYQHVILDLPHLWTPWVASAFNSSDSVVLVSQLWLKSVTHASRLLYSWKEAGVDVNRVHAVINRSGAKYKEGVTAKDFERVTQKTIQFHLSNDIRSIAAAENEGKTILEVTKSRLSQELQGLAAYLGGEKAEIMLKQKRG